MNGILDIKKSFLDIKNSISWYQEIVNISRHEILGIKKCLSWYQEIYAFNFFYIKKWNSWYQEIKIFDIKKYLINSKTAPRNKFHDIKKSSFWYQELVSWYIKNSIFWFQKINFIFWYQELYFSISRNEFLISENRILNIKKYCHFLISKIEFLISRNPLFDIKNSISRYQEIYSEAPFYHWLSISWYQEFDFFLSRNRILYYKIIIFVDIQKSNS